MPYNNKPSKPVVDKLVLFLAGVFIIFSGTSCTSEKDVIRERISINQDWSFMKYDSAENSDSLIYDVRPPLSEYDDAQAADTEPEDAITAEADRTVLKPWILPTGNAFIKDAEDRHDRPDGHPGSDFPFVQYGFDDSSWEDVDLPHDWAIKGPFFEGDDAEVTGGMGRLPSPGVAWYRKKLDVPASDEGRSIYLDVDGAMSYAMVWLNGNLVGGWPFGYASWRLDLTPFIEPGGENQLAIRLDNPPESSRWYPGGGIYRNMWLTKTHPVHVGHWGTFITTPEVSKESATINLELTIDNNLSTETLVLAETSIYELRDDGERSERPVANFDPVETSIDAGQSSMVESSITLESPRLWGPKPTQTPNLYLAVTSLIQNNETVDIYETEFGIRSLEMDPDRGVTINGEHIHLRGANLHHDLGALGAAFNERAAERQLEVLQEIGVNAIRTAHNPPAPEQLALADRMGFLVIDESFDVWERRKAPYDFHLIFPDWHEQDLRALVRRDRNHPSVIMWSTGNEVGEQYTGEAGAELSMRLREIVEDEDTTRPTTVSMNYAKPPMAFPDPVEVISLNYQGEGIRNAPAYSHLQGINTEPLYPSFRETYPGKVIVSSENAAAVSSRSTYLFPVFDGISSPVSEGQGGDPENAYVSAYELYTTDFGSSADKVFRSLDQHPYVAGGFVWSGWDYLGEPTPYYSARSSYFGVVDLAGFKKDRYYLYQSNWRPDLPQAHILPHWNWPERVGEVTPVHVFTSGDEAELFLNGESLGRKQKGEFEYRLRWDDVTYEPGELHLVAYKDGKAWAEDTVETTGEAASLNATADRDQIKADGKDLSFITVEVMDSRGRNVPTASNEISFSLYGPGEIVATDNGDPTNFTPFPSHERKAFNGLALVIVRGISGKTGTITVRADAENLDGVEIHLNTVE